MESVWYLEQFIYLLELNRRLNIYLIASTLCIYAKVYFAVSKNNFGQYSPQYNISNFYASYALLSIVTR